ncbi:DUF1566 domain-containing protein [Trinickia sp.]|uniref:DUF1566 domain-containing protein n=1 Tax=Trinickia sp. TaxID=2571163 RepID=UPI003F803447
MSEVIASSTLKVPQLGQYWEGQGGIYAGIMPGENDQRPYHLIVSEESGDGLEWGGYGHRVDGADSRIDGMANTKAILAADGEHPAAEWAVKYTRDGHSDFYLPAQREQNLCFATIPDQFETDDWYWSSTQCSAGSAWGQYFDDGFQYYAGKDFPGRARAVRRIEI